ncbi:BglG family transcription antiterminator [Senegalia massiliensis]|uniref:BglG family transcription antiterminator n=1 Tax=Senegalia massiliensis TaxID=1720316 RepID=UPI00102FEB5F|nr:BglG family transcription antiterminator [Senegalia massiliensis]
MEKLLSTRLNKILDKLINSNEYLTSSYLAKLTGVSSRTIRSDIKELNEFLNPYNTKIISVKGKGSKLDIKKKKQCKKLLEDISTREELKLNTIPDFPHQRVVYIIKRLLAINVPITLEKLGDELYVSLSTIKNDLKVVKSTLKDYNLKIIVKENKGIMIEGKEIDKRFCISQYVLNRENINKDIISDSYNSKISKFNNMDWKFIENILQKELVQQEFYLADIAFNNLIIHIAIALERIILGNFVPLEDKKIEKLKNEKEYYIAENIVKILEDIFEVNIPESETCYITMHLLGSKLLEKDEEKELLHLIDNQIKSLISKIINEIKNKLNMDFNNDNKLIYNLALHLKPALHRAKYNMNIRNPLINDIKNKYPLAFQIGIIATNVIKRETNYIINEDEIGYIAMHFGGALERKKRYSQKIKNIAIICSSGMGTANLLLAKLKNSLSINANFIGTYPLHELDRVKNIKPDIILTTIPIQEEIGIPVILVKTILDDEDLIYIRNKIENLYKDTGSQKSLENLFKEDLFFTNLDFKNKEDVIKFLTNQMTSGGYINSDIQKSIFQREQVSSTAIGNLIAIPHPLKATNIESSVCVGILKNSIEWEEDRKVQLVLILVLSKNMTNSFERLFNTIYKATKSSAHVSQLINSKKFKEFYSKFTTEKEEQNKWN